MPPLLLLLLLLPLLLLPLSVSLLPLLSVFGMSLIEFLFELVATVIAPHVRQLTRLVPVRHHAPSPPGFDPNPVLPETPLQLAPRGCLLEVMACHFRDHVPKGQLAGSLVPVNLPSL